MGAAIAMEGRGRRHIYNGPVPCALSDLRHFGGSCIFVAHTRSVASVRHLCQTEASGILPLHLPWRPRDARLLSMNKFRGDLSAPFRSALALALELALALPLAKRRFLQQQRRRPSAARRRRTSTADTITTRYTPTPTPTPTPHPKAIAASRRRHHPSRHLDLRHTTSSTTSSSSLLAVEAPLKRRRTQALLLPTSARHPP